MQASTMFNRYREVLLTLSLAWVAGWLWFTWSYWEDDAYIHIEYARNVWLGRGFMFNGLISNGDTSPVWVVLLVSALSTGLEWLTAGKALTILCTAFSLWMLWHFTRSLCRDASVQADSLPGWMLALFVASPYFCYWAFSGMEAVWAAGWLMLQSLLLMPGKPTTKTLLGAALCVGLGPLIRPEMVLMFVAGGPFLLYQWWQVSRDMTPTKRWGLFLAAAILLALPLLIWIGYALHAFGYVMPNTNAAKRAAPDSSVIARLLNVFGLGFTGVLLVAGALLGSWVIPALKASPSTRSEASRMLWGIPASAAPLLAWVLLTVLFYVVNHTYVQTRYALVLAPGLMSLLWVLSLRRMNTRWLAAVTVLTLVVSLSGSLLMARPHLRNKMELISAIDGMVKRIESTVPTGSGIAVYSIGQYGFQLQHHPLIDIGGITRPEASKYLFDADQHRMLDWAKKEGALYYISGDAPEPGAVLLHEVNARVTGWHLRLSTYDITSAQRLWRLPAPGHLPQE